MLGGSSQKYRPSTLDEIIVVNTWFVNVLLKMIYSSFRQTSQKRQKSPVSMISWSLCSFCEPVQRFWTSQWLIRARDPQWALLRKNESFGGFDIWQFYKIVRFVASNLERYSEFCSRHFVASKPFSVLFEQPFLTAASLFGRYAVYSRLVQSCSWRATFLQGLDPALIKLTRTS